MSRTDELFQWLLLSRTRGVSAAAAMQAIERHGGIGPLIGAADGPLKAALAQADTAAVERDLEWLAAADDHHVITRHDPRYPARLADLADAPLVLYLVGNPAAVSAPQLAMVGSRNPTPSGSETARDFARALAAVGLTITSGLALGIDAAAHQGALAGRGSTVAVLGTGPDRVYPARHRDLAHAIVAGGGALVSEFAPGTPPLPPHFPRRNRIIAGLAYGTLVVEAALRSGSLITARLATELGREVFAIPGSIHNPLARGCHRLIRDGAKLVETAQDVLEELATHLRPLLVEPEISSISPAATDAEETLDEDYRKLLACLDHNPVHVDRLVERSQLTPEVVSSMLLLLELQGYVSAVAGGYVRTPERA